MELGSGVSTLTLTSLFALISIATAVIFIVYAAEWQSDQNGLATASQIEEVYRNKVRTEFSYYASVIALLFILASMHGYALMRELL